MKKSKLKQKRPAVKQPTCEEKFVCTSDNCISAVKCLDCGTLQCSECDIELHRDGDNFFHQRVPIVDESNISNSSIGISNDRLHKTHGTDVLSSHDELKHRNSRDQTARSELGTAIVADTNAVQVLIEPTPGYETNKTVPLKARADPWEDSESPSLEQDSETEEFYSLNLDQILCADVRVSDMKGPSKKSKKKLSSPSSAADLKSVPRMEEISVNADAEYFTGQEGPGMSQTEGHPSNDSAAPDQGDEDLITDLMQSMTDVQLGASLRSNGRKDSGTNGVPSSRTDSTAHCKSASKKSDCTVSFLLIDETETLQVCKSTSIDSVLMMQSNDEVLL